MISEGGISAGRGHDREGSGCARGLEGGGQAASSGDVLEYGPGTAKPGLAVAGGGLAPQAQRGASEKG